MNKEPDKQLHAERREHSFVVIRGGSITDFLDLDAYTLASPEVSHWDMGIRLRLRLRRENQ